MILGLVGLGGMGNAFALNLMENDIDVVAFDKNKKNIELLSKTAIKLGLVNKLKCVYSLRQLLQGLKPPRSIILLIPSDEKLDDFFYLIKGLLSKNDLLIDMGNSFYRETENRMLELEKDGISLLGVGLSGGINGARFGPSIMAGGRKKDWRKVGYILKKVSAMHEGLPCCDLVGPGGSGHFVKMLHNGIEYAYMQQISEIYGFMRDHLAMDAPSIGEVFEDWNKGLLDSYLLNAASQVCCAVDPELEESTLDTIIATADQKGTGRLSVIEALRLSAISNIIYSAVNARIHSSYMSCSNNFEAKAQDKNSLRIENREKESILELLRKALLFGKVCSYGQGFEVIKAGSVQNNWHLDLGKISQIFASGSIVKSRLLKEVCEDFTNHELTDFVQMNKLGFILEENYSAIKEIILLSIKSEYSMPTLYASFELYNTRKQTKSTANLIQGMRDYFGNHGFRTYKSSKIKHGPWKI